jgi:hypothetical protein
MAACRLEAVSGTATCNEQGTQRTGCLRAEKLDNGETSGSPVSREAYGDGAAIVLECLG